MPEVASTFSVLTDPAMKYDKVVPQGGIVVPKMGTIVERRRKDGSLSYTAQIVIKQKGKKPHREAQTFNRRGAAVAWLKIRERELKAEGGVERARALRLTVGDAIDRYVRESADIGRTKAQVLEAIKATDLGKMEAADVKSADIVTFARELGKTVKPQTVQNYLSHLSAVFRIANAAWEIPLDKSAMQDAFTVAKKLGLTSKSEKRDRRPTLDELDKLMEFFGERQERAPGAAPMQKIIAYGIFSTRRMGEIIRPLGKHLDAAHSRLLIEDMKHPGQKRGNDVWVDLPAEALAIIKTMPISPDRPIFPYTEDAIGAAFTRACQVLGIVDLHFHDLRHDGVSRLFEMGWNIPHVAAVSGHRAWASLQRYTHLRQAGDKYEGWKWLPVVTKGD